MRNPTDDHSRPARPRIPLRRWRDDRRGVAAVEFAIVTPIVLSLLAIALVGSEGVALQRKVSLTARTVTDLTTQQKSVMPTDPYPIATVMSAASSVMTPYDATNLSMVISEVQTNGTTTANVIWSNAAFNGVALSVPSTITIPASIASSGYLIVGTVNYAYNPLSIFQAASPLTLSDTIYMSPRVSTNIACCNPPPS
jgi:Flp pilus assembly protein TadG